MLQVQVLHTSEIFVILWIRSCVTAFDHIDAKLVQPRGDRQLVFDRQRNAFLLSAVSQSSVV